MTEERYRLAIGRIREMKKETSVNERFRDYFRKMAEFFIMIDELKESLESGSYQAASLAELGYWNKRLYQDILPENYEMSYGNPTFAAKRLGEDYGKILCFLYGEMRGAVVYAFEDRAEYLDILMELLIEVYNQFEETGLPEIRNIKDTIYWYASDYCDVFVADRIKEQVCPEESLAVKLILESDLTSPRYLYQFGEYISENERKTAEHLGNLDESAIQKMADTCTEGYRRGFVNTGKDLSKKASVNIRYVLGFERVIRKVIENFEAMGLKPIIYRSAVSALTKRQHLKIGYYGGIANKQYDYDHKDDQALFLDKQFAERKLEVIQRT